MPKLFGKKQNAQKNVIVSQCPYCGCACQIGYVVDESGKIIGAQAVKDDVVSQGKPCIKGLTSHEPINCNRIATPMMRRNKNEELRPCTWEEAYDFIYERTKNLSADEIAFAGSGSYTNEDNYVLQKFARVVFKTNSIDSCARLCHVATAWALNKVIGITAMPTEMDDVLDCDVILILGTNPASNYPVFFNRILEAKKKGAKVITVGIEPSQTASQGDISVDIYAEGLVSFLGGLIKAIAPLAPPKIKSLPGFEQMLDCVSIFTPERVAKMCDIDEKDYLKIIDLVARAKNLAVLHGMGLTQHINGTQNALASTNLAMLKEGKIIPMRGKMNIQGAADVGICPDFVPCGGSASATEKIWGVPPPMKQGKKLPEAVLFEPVKALYIMGMSPAQSLPDLNKVHEQFKKMFIVLQHQHPNITMKFADVVLPSPMLPEKEGTITNAERRVRYVQQAAEPPAKKQDWQIICELAARFGHAKQFTYDGAEEIFDEITKVVPDYADLSWKKVLKSDKAFANKRIEFIRFQPIDIGIDSIRPVSKEFPFILTTSRQRWHFCTGEATRCTPQLLELSPQAFCYVGPADAEKIGVKDDDVVAITSKVGTLELPIRINKSMKKPGIIIVPFHFEDALVNKLVPSYNLDTVTKTPSYKAVAVNVEKLEK